MSNYKAYDATAYALRLPIIFWMPNQAEYQDFLHSYVPENGFLLTKTMVQPKGNPQNCYPLYVLFHGNYRYKLKFFNDTDTKLPIGFSISERQPIGQLDTLTIATNSIRVTGLPKAFFTLINDLHLLQNNYYLSDCPAALKTIDHLLEITQPAHMPEVDPLWNRLLEISEAKRNFDANFTIRWPYTGFRPGDKLADAHEYRFVIAPPDRVIEENEARFDAFRQENGLIDQDSQADPSQVTLRKRYISAFDAESGTKKYIEIATANPKRAMRGSIIRLELPGVTHDSHGKPLKLPENFYKNDRYFDCPWSLVIAVKDDSAVAMEEIPATDGIITEQVSTDYARYRAALQTMMTPINTQSWSAAEQVIVHHTVTAFTRDKEPIFHSDKLNPQQKAAIRMAINAPDFCLIQGPPGTGKTTIINEMLYNFIAEGKKVLVCSKGNLAVDNVLEKWIEENKDRPDGHLCVRLGSNSRLMMMKDYSPEAITDRLQQKIFNRTLSARNTLVDRISGQLEMITTHGRSVEQLLQLCSNLATLAKALEPLCSIYRLVTEKHASRASNMPQKLAYAQRAYDTLYCKMLLPAYEALFSETTPLLSEFDAHWQQVQADMDAALVPCKPGFLNILMMLFRYIQWIWRENTLRECRNSIDSSTIRGSFIKGNPLTAISKLQPPKLPDRPTPEEIIDAVQGYQDAIGYYARRESTRLEHIREAQNAWLKELGSGVSQPMEKHVVLDSIPVVGSTCMGIAAKGDFTDIVYDVVIVDEAGQIPIFDLLVPLVKSKKVILIGDHRQLPPMDANDFAKYFAAREQAEKGANFDEVMREVSKWYNTSLFEMLYNAKDLAHAREMLDTQFRMHPHISHFISNQFYMGSYKAGVAPEARQLQIAGFADPIYFFDTGDLPQSQRFETKDNQGIYNKTEAKLMANTLVKLILAINEGNYRGPELVQRSKLDGRITGYDIGVISGYQQQVDLIKNLTRQKLREALPEATAEELNQLLQRVSINTLDSFQGRDNQIILFSLTRSNSIGKVGFLRDVRRLNVAMTRAKSLLIMVGDSKTLTASHARCAHDPSKPVAKVFDDLITYCQEKGYYHVLKGGDSNGVE